MAGAVKMPPFAKMQLRKGAPPKAPGANKPVSPRPTSPGRNLPVGPQLARGPSQELLATLTDTSPPQEGASSGHRESLTMGRRSPRPVSVAIESGSQTVGRVKSPRPTSVAVDSGSSTVGRPKSPRPSAEDGQAVGRGRGRGRPSSRELRSSSADVRGMPRPMPSSQALAQSAPHCPQVAPVAAGGGGHRATIRHSTTSIEARKVVESQLSSILGGSSDKIPQANKKSVEELLTMMATGRGADVNTYLNSLSQEDRDLARSSLKKVMDSAAAMF